MAFQQNRIPRDCPSKRQFVFGSKIPVNDIPVVERKKRVLNSFLNYSFAVTVLRGGKSEHKQTIIVCFFPASS
jgi:hypothetical protein